jgi:predicted dehydrogenase
VWSRFVTLGPKSWLRSQAGIRRSARQTLLPNLLRDPQIDAIAIAAPVRSHFEMALAALDAGKHLLIEKPMSETADQACRLLSIWQRAPRRFEQ